MSQIATAEDVFRTAEDVSRTAVQKAATAVPDAAPWWNHATACLYLGMCYMCTVMVAAFRLAHFGAPGGSQGATRTGLRTHIAVIVPYIDTRA